MRAAAAGTTVLAAVGISVGVGAAAAQASGGGGLSTSWAGTSARVSPGRWVSVGYSVSMPGAHAEAVVDVTAIAFGIAYQCEGGPGGTWTVAAPPARLTMPAGSAAWLPTASTADPAGWEAAAPVPALCGQGGMVLLGSARSGGEGDRAQSASGGAAAPDTFSAALTSADTTDPLAVRVHVGNASGGAPGVDCADATANPPPGRRSCAAAWIDAGQTTAGAPPQPVTAASATSASTAAAPAPASAPSSASAPVSAAVPPGGGASAPAGLPQQPVASGLSPHALTGRPSPRPAAPAASGPGAHGHPASAPGVAPVTAGVEAATAVAAAPPAIGPGVPSPAAVAAPPTAVVAPAALTPDPPAIQVPRALASASRLGVDIWHWLAIAAGLNGVFLVVTLARRARALQSDL